MIYSLGEWMEAGPIPTFSSPSHMHRREFDYGLHQYEWRLSLFSRVFLRNSFALASAAADVLDQPGLAHLS